MGHHSAGRKAKIPAPSRPTIFIECQRTSGHEHNTGIGRVVRSIVRHAPEVMEAKGYDVVLVAARLGRLVMIDPVLVLGAKAPVTAKNPPISSSGLFKTSLRIVVRRLWPLAQRIIVSLLPTASVRSFVYAPSDVEGLGYYVSRPWRIITGFSGGLIPEAGTLDEYDSLDGSVLLLLDAGWGVINWRSIERFRKSGGKVVAVLYDLIPIYFPSTVGAHMCAMFDAWLHQLARHTDAVLGISQAAIDDLVKFAGENFGAHEKLPRLGYFHLGSGLDQIRNTDPVRPSTTGLFSRSAHAFLMVGSLAPHKNHGFVLSAFEEYWAQGGTGSLIIVGSLAWSSEDFLDRVASHPELGKRLHLLRDVKDSELNYLYGHVSALIMASLQEGFGLPVVEAFQRGLQVLCSDLPVLREIGEGRAWFFGLASPQMLSETLFAFEQRYPPGGEFDRTPMPWIDWKQSTEWLFREMFSLLGTPTALLVKALSGVRDD